MSFVSPQLPPAHRADTFSTPGMGLTRISARRFDSHGGGSEGLKSSRLVAFCQFWGRKGGVKNSSYDRSRNVTENKEAENRNFRRTR